MANARPGVHVVCLKPVQVNQRLVAGKQFIRLGEDPSNIAIITLKVDSNGYILYWKESNKETEFIDISLVRDTRTGRQAKQLRDFRLRDAVKCIDPWDGPVEDRLLTVAHGTDMVNLTYQTFVAETKETAKEWGDEIFLYARNLLALNNCPLKFLERSYTKLIESGDSDGKPPVRNVVRMFAQSRDDRKKVEQALTDAHLVSGKNDRLTHLTPQSFFNFYHHLCGRQEIDKVFREVGGRKGFVTVEQFVEFLNFEQRDPRLNEILFPQTDQKRAQMLIEQFETSRNLASKGHLSQDGFLRYLMSEENAILPPEKFDLCDDMNQPLSHYFISSSHNTYLTGNQWTGKSSVDIYRQVLLSGCRCVELDCWDGKGTDEEPVITHGFTICSEISLKEVLEAISDSAFKVSDYPVILSFENHCSPRQQIKIALHCRNIFGEALLSDPLDGFPLEADIPLPSPELLKRKILIKNKKRHVQKVDVCESMEEVEPERKNYEQEQDENLTEFKKQGAAADEKVSAASAPDPEAEVEMSDLVNYIQPERFISLEHAEKERRSYQCTSFVETQATALLNEFPVDFVNFNKRQISRIYPKGSRSDSSNYIPQIFWNAGCQLVALNFQTLDLAMQLNLGFFERNRMTGYLLKPECMRRKDRQFDPFADSTVDGIVAGHVEIKVISGQCLTDKKIGTYVTVDMYGLPADTVRRKFRTKSVPGNGINPVYDEEPFVFRKIILPSLASIRIGVYNEGNALIGHRILPVEGLRPGYRHIGLRNECNQPSGMATLFVHIKVNDYIPDAFADFAAALANPIAYQSQLDKHAQQLAILEDDFEPEAGAPPVGPDTPVQAPETNASRHEAPSKGPNRVGSVTERSISHQDSVGASETISPPEGSKCSSVPASPLHIISTDASGGVGPGSPLNRPTFTKIDVVNTTKLLDQNLLEPTVLSTLRENRQYLKLHSKLTRDLESLQRKHEKFQVAKVQLCHLEEEKLSASQTKSRLNLERTQAKATKHSSADEAAFARCRQELDNLATDHAAQLKSARQQHLDDLVQTFRDHLVTEEEFQLSNIPTLYGKLEQLAAAWKETVLARINKVHDHEVVELKKQMDSHNWEDMKVLAKKHRDKNELARVRREAMQKHINVAVQERQKLRSILEQKIVEVEELYTGFQQQISTEKETEEISVRKTFESKCSQLEERCRNLLQKNQEPGSRTGSRKGISAGRSSDEPPIDGDEQLPPPGEQVITTGDQLPPSGESMQCLIQSEI